MHTTRLHAIWGQSLVKSDIFIVHKYVCQKVIFHRHLSVHKEGVTSNALWHRPHGRVPPRKGQVGYPPALQKDQVGYPPDIRPGDSPHPLLGTSGGDHLKPFQTRSFWAHQEWYLVMATDTEAHPVSKHPTGMLLGFINFILLNSSN